ncbi:uncharacterized protein AMSG_02795 [Thecamonas trahens ATCC 50062]|uniref:Phosphatidylserine decarboxylase n=1 Tax=Thecamonas trahens ATCC 50062 TaxID=461836 RepID=A0A0L0D4W1_THETB|nr:hypothetical protein AMSG_02795 [Thecamonas trahens ATCC 50062]KNC46343.1 hypothetical protein AMSG_02795 [Thecamonas trahens ATCC 50062]|eukprot:XP_013760636.1 hypothetical protein AMSG_02795 [Thecamonas trahens ATCC 50062]
MVAVALLVGQAQGVGLLRITVGSAGSLEMTTCSSSACSDATVLYSGKLDGGLGAPSSGLGSWSGEAFAGPQLAAPVPLAVIDSLIAPTHPSWQSGSVALAALGAPLDVANTIVRPVLGNVTFSLGAVGNIPQVAHVVRVGGPAGVLANSVAVCGEALPVVAARGDVLNCQVLVPGNGSYPLTVTFAAASELATGSAGVFDVSVPAGGAAWVLDAVAGAPGARDGLAAVGAGRVAATKADTAAYLDIQQWNEDRQARVRVMVGVMYALIAIVMTLAALNAAVWQAWMFPMFLAAPAMWWFATLFVGMHALSWMGGFGAWALTSGLLVLYGMIAPIVYCCIRMRVRKKSKARIAPSPTELSTVSEQEEAAKTPSGSYSSQCSSSGSVESPSRDEASGSESDHEYESDDDGDVSARSARSSATLSELANYTRRPAPLSKIQKTALLMVLGVVAVATATAVTVFMVWDLKTYKVTIRESRTTLVEYQPQLIAKSIQLVYGFERMAKIIRFGFVLRAQSKACGVYFKQRLTSNEDKKVRIADAFITKYGIDMSLFNRTEYWQFDSVNDWFIRRLRDGARPLASPGSTAVISSVADCRLTVFNSIDRDVSFWLKGEDFSVYRLLDSNLDLTLQFAGGSMALFRLAPADYHRTHSPIAGTITAQFSVKSTLYSVNADAVRSGCGAVYNDRVITIIDSGVPGRKVAFVAIGATCVGSVAMMKGVGATVTRGEDISNFQFGGSTVAVLFPPGSMAFDDDLIVATSFQVETLVNVRTQIGRWL